MEVGFIKDKTFIITGGASGLGAQYASMLLHQGAKSVAVLDIAESHGKALVEKYKKTHPGKVIFIKCDMSKEDDIAKVYEEVLSQFKQVDVIINNAGIMVDSPECWRAACDVNFQGLVSLTMKGIRHMNKSEGGAGGTIVNISSTAALTRVPFLPIYSAAKSAVMHFCRCIAMDPFYENTGVRVLCLCLGPTDTPLLQNLDKRTYDPKLGKVFAESTVQMGVYFQKVESAIASMEYVMKTGASGSVWLSVQDKPVKNITAVIDQAYSLLEKEFMP